MDISTPSARMLPDNFQGRVRWRCRFRRVRGEAGCCWRCLRPGNGCTPEQVGEVSNSFRLRIATGSRQVTRFNLKTIVQIGVLAAQEGQRAGDAISGQEEWAPRFALADVNTLVSARAIQRG